MAKARADSLNKTQSASDSQRDSHLVRAQETIAHESRGHSSSETHKRHLATSYADCLKKTPTTLESQRNKHSAGAHESREICCNVTQKRQLANNIPRSAYQVNEKTRQAPTSTIKQGRSMEKNVSDFTLSNKFGLLDPEENLSHSATNGDCTQSTPHQITPEVVHEHRANLPDKAFISNCAPLPTNPANDKPLTATPKSSWHKHSKFLFWVDKEASIPPFSGKDVQVKCRESQGHAVVHPLYTTHKCMMTFPGLHEISNHRSTVRLINMTPAVPWTLGNHQQT